VFVRGETYGLSGWGIGCEFMQRWAKRFLRHGREPRGWYCVGDSYEGGTCHKRDVRPHPYFDFYIFD
jgi:hypothetical protein